MKYPNLLMPLRVGNHVLKNRLIYPNASPHFLQGPENYPAEGYRAFVANLARNGAAVVNVAEWNNPNQRKFPSDMDISHMQSFDLTDPAVHNYLSQMAEEVHFYGSKLIVTLNLEFQPGYTLNGGPAPFAPGGGDTQPVPRKLIPEAVQRNVERARFYKNLGFDGVSIRCDADMLPADQPRQDEYGGSLENRTRFLREVLTRIKETFGSDFLIEGVIAWEQPDGYGIHQRANGGYFKEDAVAFIRLTEGIIDIMQIRENNGCTSHPTGYNSLPGVHPALDFALEMKNAGVKTLMEPIGGFQDPEEMECALAEGKCDLFGAARAFMADYDYGKKLYAGQGENIVPCLKCNKCHGTILPEHEPWVSVCSVNPVMGKWGKLARMLGGQRTGSKKVAVIGGGPAGMRAALFAAEQGHQVALFERSGQLGGQLFHSDYFSFKWPVRNYRDWLVRQLEHSAVEVHMNTEPTPEEIRAGSYDAVLAATGAQAVVPRSIEGLWNEDGTRKAEVLTCLDALPLEKTLGKHVIICGGSEVGMETAMFLCEQGHEVTVLTRQKELGHNASKLHYITTAWVRRNPDGSAEERPAWEHYSGLHGKVCVTTKRVNGTTVTYTEADGAERQITGDSVLICGGMKPNLEQAMKYAGLSDQFFPIGDCNGAGNLQRCNEEAYARVMIL